jgi:hypothetical protein
MKNILKENEIICPGASHENENIYTRSYFSKAKNIVTQVHGAKS